MKRLCLILISAILAGCSSGSNKPGKAVLRDAQRVEVFRVGPEREKDVPGKMILGYPILATGTEQGADFAGRLSQMLLSAGVTPNKKKCGLQPGIAYRIWKKDRAVEVLVCFQCDVLWPHEVGLPWNRLAKNGRILTPFVRNCLPWLRKPFRTMPRFKN
jgi:hypothetical protein